jgi:hypothetical protein
MNQETGELAVEEESYAVVRQLPFQNPSRPTEPQESASTSSPAK